MTLSHLLTLIITYQIPLAIIAVGAIIYCSIIKFMGNIPTKQALIMFLTGIIVITCIFLPFNWSLNNSGEARQVSLFFFSIDIEGNNFIAILKNVIDQSQYIHIIEGFFSRYQGTGNELSTDIITLFLAFLEELSKLTLLILAIRKSLRFPVMIVYLVLVYGLVKKLGGIENISSFVPVMVIAIVVGMFLFSLLGTKLRMLSVADYIYSIALVAAGFAFAENIKYMIDLSNAGSDMISIQENAMLRSIFGYLSHIFFSIVCVALYARGRFAFLRYIDQSGNLSLTQRALGWQGFTQLKTIQGFWTGVLVASIIHGVYNTMIGAGNILIPSAILLVGFLFLEFFVLHDLRNNTKYGNLELYMK